MKSQRIGGTDEHPVHLLAFETGEPIISTIEGFARENGIDGAHFHAIGAVSSATLAWYDLGTKRYEETTYDEQLEVCALVGNVSRFGDETRLHAHCVLGRRDTKSIGGHLIRATVRPTLELFLTAGARIERTMDEEVGLALL